MNGTANILVAARKEESRVGIIEALPNLRAFIHSDVINDESDAIIKTDRLKPNVLILDLELAAEYGVNIVRIIRRRSPSTAIIVIGDKDDDFTCSVLKAGICGFLIKEEDIYKLESIVKLILSGGKYISASIIDRIFNTVSLINQFPGQFMEVNHPIFSPAERCIITDLAKGYSDDEIAAHLHLSKGSIRNIITAIRRKTKMKSRIGIVVFSLVYGLIRLDDFEKWNEMRDMIFQESEKNQNTTKKKRGRKPKVGWE